MNFMPALGNEACGEPFKQVESFGQYNYLPFNGTSSNANFRFFNYKFATCVAHWLHFCHYIGRGAPTNSVQRGYEGEKTKIPLSYHY
jgi:hypothetical protein